MSQPSRIGLNPLLEVTLQTEDITVLPPSFETEAIVSDHSVEVRFDIRISFMLFGAVWTIRLAFCLYLSWVDRTQENPHQSPPPPTTRQSSSSPLPVIVSRTSTPDLESDRSSDSPPPPIQDAEMDPSGSQPERMPRSYLEEPMPIHTWRTLPYRRPSPYLATRYATPEASPSPPAVTST